MEPLSQRYCIACRGDIPALQGAQLHSLTEELGRAWQVVEEHHLFRRFDFFDFAQAMAFAQKVGEIAEMVWHHPDLAVGWGYVEVKIYTHKINGLVESDFILAAKINEIYQKLV